MAGLSKIEWTEATWNPVTGCDKISPGCKNCYAERLALRLQAAGTRQYKDGFALTLHPESLDVPLGWKKPRVIFVNSMSDLFHRNVPIEFIREVFDVMRAAPQHQFQILTKRADRLAELDRELPWSDNVWMGVSVESEDYVRRIEHLKQTRARIKFLSLEPLLGPLSHLELKGIDWVIVGGESGPYARSMKPQWVRQIRAQCIEAKVPFFFKQWGGVFKSKTGRTLDGRTWDQMPKVERLQPEESPRALVTSAIR
ncbi:MAG: phage Gp37/Gp68 family protein [Nitrospira sp.]